MKNQKFNMSNYLNHCHSRQQRLDYGDYRQEMESWSSFHKRMKLI